MTLHLKSWTQALHVCGWSSSILLSWLSLFLVYWKRNRNIEINSDGVCTTFLPAFLEYLRVLILCIIDSYYLHVHLSLWNTPLLFLVDFLFIETTFSYPYSFFSFLKISAHVINLWASFYSEPLCQYCVPYKKG